MSSNTYIHQAFKNLFNIHKGELSSVLLLLCFSFFTGVSFVFYSTATVSVFVSIFKADALPYAFITSGIVGYLLWYAFAKVQRYLTFGNLLVYGYLFLLISIATLIVMSEISGNKWWYFAMFVWMRFFTFLNAVMFGGLVARIFNLQQGKRLFALISSGDVVSQMLGYFSIPFLLRSFGISTLLLISVSGILLHLITVFIININYKHLVTQPPTKVNNTKAEANQYGKDWREYLTLLFIVSLLPMLGFYYVDYMFLTEIKVEYNSKEALAGFLGIFMGGVAVIELLTRLFLSGRLLSSYGLRFGIRILPLTLTLSTGLIIIFFVLPGFGGLVFSMIALSKLLERVLRFSFNDPAFQIFYQPVPPEQRFSFRTMLEGVPKSLGVIIAGLLILTFNLLGFKSALYLNLLFLAVLIIWLYVTSASYKTYCRILNQFVQNKFLAKRTIADTEMVLAAQPQKDSIVIAKAYNLISHQEWNEYETLNQSVCHPTGATRVSERVCMVFMLSSILPGHYFKSWVAADHILASLLKSRYYSSGSLMERLRIIELLADAAEDVSFLKEQLFVKQPILGLFISRKISKFQIDLSTKERNDCKVWIEYLMGSIVWYEACERDLAVDITFSQLSNECQKERTQLYTLLFHGLSLLYPPAAVDEIEQSLVKKPSDDGRMLAYELLENLFDADIKEKILLLFSNAEFHEKITALAEHYPQRTMDVYDRLEDILLKEYQLVPLYLKIIALNEIGKRPHSKREPLLKESLQNVHTLLAATAGKCLSEVHGDLYQTYFNQLNSEQQKNITTQDSTLINKIEFLITTKPRALIHSALLPDYAESFIDSAEEVVFASSGTCIPLSESSIEISSASIHFHDAESRIMVIKKSMMPALRLFFKQKSFSLLPILDDHH